MRPWLWQLRRQNATHTEGKPHCPAAIWLLCASTLPQLLPSHATVACISMLTPQSLRGACCRGRRRCSASRAWVSISSNLAVTASRMTSRLASCTTPSRQVKVKDSNVIPTRQHQIAVLHDSLQTASRTMSPSCSPNGGPVWDAVAIAGLQGVLGKDHPMFEAPHPEVCILSRCGYRSSYSDPEQRCCAIIDCANRSVASLRPQHGSRCTSGAWTSSYVCIFTAHTRKPLPGITGAGIWPGR